MQSTIRDGGPLIPALAQELSANDRDARLDCITELAIKATGASIGGVSLIFQSQMWMPSRYGVDNASLPRVGSFCTVALESGEECFEVRDAAADPRFGGHLMVATAQLRHYAGVLLRGAGGHRFGTLWVMGEEARVLDPDQMAQLRLLADAAAETLSARYCDNVTGLYNRMVFLHHLQCVVDHAGGSTGVTVGYIDLIGFRQWNSILGRSSGDAILRQVGKRVAGWSGVFGLTGNLGGDRFAFALEGAESDNAVLVEALCRAIDAPFDADTARGRQVHARIGIVHAPAGATMPAEGLLDAAEAAAQAVGHARKSSVVRKYDRAMEAGAHLRQQLLAMQGGAKDFGELEVHYQPQVDVLKGCLVGFEALVRWRHPVLGLIGPNRFISLAEDSGDIAELDLLVMRRVCEDVKTWLAMGLPVPPVALNASHLTLMHPDMLARTKASLADSGVAGVMLEVEVTESLMLDEPEILHERVSDLRALGVRIAVDDFGTGYSNLDTLSSFPFDRLKADRRFVHGVATNPRTAGLLTLIRGIAGVFGAELLCEGLEHQNDIDWLRNQGIGCVQGWYFGAARPASEVQAWLVRFQQQAGSRLDPLAMRALLN